MDGRRALPIAYALLPSKSRAVYSKVVTVLKGLLTFEPDCLQTIHLDFEMAMIRVVNTEFPGIMVAGCSFHFRKAIKHNLDINDCKTLYQQCPLYQFAIR